MQEEKSPGETIIEQEEPKPKQLFPEIYDINSLIIDPSLPIIRFINFEPEIQTREKTIDLSIKLPQTIYHADLFLFINGKKKDMFYQVNGGEYTFRHIPLTSDENKLEFFYKTGEKRSVSVYSIIKRG